MPRTNPQERHALEEGLSALGLAPEAKTVEGLLTYLGELRRWARTYNLVGPGELDRLLARHVLDSLSIHAHLAPGTLLDVGTGAGFPGIPLALLDPTRSVVLVDSAGKKVRFLRHVARTLGLERVDAVHERVERFSPGTEFSTITSRAFSSLGDFTAAVRHLATPATRLLAMKGRHPEEELAALPEGVRVVAVTPLDVPGLDARRHLVTLAVTDASREEDA